MDTMNIRRICIMQFLIALSILILCNMSLTATSKPALADPGTLKWTRIDTPGALPSRNDIVSPCEINRIAIGSDSKTLYAVDTAYSDNTNGSRALYKSTDSGISWNDNIGRRLYEAMTSAEQVNFHIWNIAVAPDNVKFIAAVTNDSTSVLPRQVWISKNGGAEWQNTNFPVASNISTIEVSASYSNGTRDIVLGTRSGAGDGTIWILKIPAFSWSSQEFTGDVMVLKLSPDYTSDGVIAIVYSNTSGTYLNAGVHDLNANTTDWNMIYRGNPPEITAGAPGTSPKADEIIGADLELPADFSGQAPSLRRYYISIDDAGASGNGGIYRIDGTTVHQLMSATMSKRISSIAYHGTYASGKLLAGEVLGDPCSATAMTWFTDSPTTCPIPCWYPAMKPPTGAAGDDNCTGSGYANAQVAWSPDGSTAYAGTASSAALAPGINWPVPYLTGKELDESAFSLTRNNGETWNQIALIDTNISVLTDIAPTPDCSTVYVASVNGNSDCSGFDSVWRSQGSPIGACWERVLCIPTTHELCATSQTDLAILRLAGDRTDGQVVFWAAIGTRKLMWSPDFGDYWTHITGLQHNIQDVAAEDSSTLYTLSADGFVQKFTFKTAGWLPHTIVHTGLNTGYSIATAYSGLTPDNDKGHIVVGSMGIGSYDVAYSTDGGTTFSTINAQLPTRGNTLVVIHSGYKSNGEIFAINNGGMYEWSIYYGGGTWSWPLPEKGNWATLWGGLSWPTPVTGLTISRNGSFYFSDSWGSYIRWALASAGLDSLVSFGTEPTTRYRICGGLASGEPITVWLIDQRPYVPPQGCIWIYVDPLAWNGPTPISPISNTPVKYDPTSGRAGEITLKWQPMSLSRGYRIQIAKDEDFAIQLADIGSTWGGPFYTPPDLDAPALVIPAGGGTITDGNGNTWTVPALEVGHSYYWRVMVQDVTTGDLIQSPWSWREIFTVHSGLRVSTPYYSPQLLSPVNGCIDCPRKAISFSWSPLQTTQRYKFALARNAAMTDIVVETELPTTSYNYEGTLDYNTVYFWRVMAIEPEVSEWSATFCFQTETEPALVPLPQKAAATPVWAWTLIVIGAILDICLFIIILRRWLT